MTCEEQIEAIREIQKNIVYMEGALDDIAFCYQKTKDKKRMLQAKITKLIDELAKHVNELSQMPKRGNSKKGK